MLNSEAVHPIVLIIVIDLLSHRFFLGTRRALVNEGRVNQLLILTCSSVIHDGLADYNAVRVRIIITATFGQVSSNCGSRHAPLLALRADRGNDGAYHYKEEHYEHPE